MPRPSLPEILQSRSRRDRSPDSDRPPMEGSEVRRVAIAVAHAPVMPESACQYKRARLRAYLLACSCCISSCKLRSPLKASLMLMVCTSLSAVVSGMIIALVTYLRHFGG
jgi:hypothetical protein